LAGVLTGFAVIASIVIVGYLLGRLDILGGNGPQVLTKLAFYVATPALLFDILSRADLSIMFSAPLVVTAISMAITAVLFIAVGALRRWGTGPTALGALCSCYVNAGNLGIPVAVYVLGDVSLVAPILLLQQLVVTPIALAVLDLGSRDGQHEQSGRTAALVRLLTTPLRTPIVVGSLCGMVVSVSGWTPPNALMQPFELVGSMAVPAVLLAFGISLYGSAMPGRGPEKSRVLLAVVLKSAVHPLVTWALAYWCFGLDGAALFAVVVLAALPSAQNMFTYAVHYGVAVRMVRETVLLSTFLTVPALLLIALLLS
jgi:malonate transporter and related proteins